MPEFILGARGHDFGRHDPETLFSSIGQAGFACTQLAFTKAVEGVKSYADVTPALVERARAAAAASGVGIAVDGTYVELSYADEDKRRAEVAKVLSQIPVAKALGAGCMGSETTNMAKQPGVTRKEAQEALLRSLGEILPACEEQGVLFAVECVYYHAMNTPEAVRMVLDTMASPNLRVICDFANYVGPEAASVDAQRRIWDKVGSWYGDKITAVHFKGQNFQPDGTLYSTSLEDSCVDYAGGRCRRLLCPCCGRKLCPPAPQVTLPLCADSPTDRSKCFKGSVPRLGRRAFCFIFRVHRKFTIIPPSPTCRNRTAVL